MTRGFRRWLFGHVVYPLAVHLRGEGDVFAFLEAYRERQWERQETIAERQARQLVDILEFASEHSPFYRSRLDGLAFTPVEVNDQVRRVPLLEKADLQRETERLRSDLRHRTTTKTTGGSTGQAVTVEKSSRAVAAEMAASWLGYGWFGVEPGDKAARFWGQPSTARRRLRFVAADVAMNRKRFSAFSFDREDLDRYWASLTRYRPDYLYGYVSMLEQLARFVTDSGLHPDWPIKVVVTTSEVLTPVQRTLIEEAFDAPVQNEYGCGEVGPIAYECPEGLLHIMAPNLYIEILKDDGSPAEPGETGEIVVTDLNNRAMPLIRYRVGDYGVPGPDCGCGRGFATLERIWGREYDFIAAPDGRKYHGEYIMYLFEDLREAGHAVDQFRVIQTEEAELKIEVVLPDESASATLTALRQMVDRRLPAFRAEIDTVPAIARRPSGKAVIVENPWLRESR